MAVSSFFASLLLWGKEDKEGKEGKESKEGKKGKEGTTPPLAVTIFLGLTRVRRGYFLSPRTPSMG